MPAEAVGSEEVSFVAVTEALRVSELLSDSPAFDADADWEAATEDEEED